LYRLPDIVTYGRKSLYTHLYLAPLYGVTPSEFREDVGADKTRMIGLPYDGTIKNVWQYVKLFSYNTGTSRTDMQTDRQTDLLYQYRSSVCWRAI